MRRRLRKRLMQFQTDLPLYFAAAATIILLFVLLTA